MKQYDIIASIQIRFKYLVIIFKFDLYDCKYLKILSFSTYTMQKNSKVILHFTTKIKHLLLRIKFSEEATWYSMKITDKTSRQWSFLVIISNIWLSGWVAVDWMMIMCRLWWVVTKLRACGEADVIDIQNNFFEITRSNKSGRKRIPLNHII